MTSAEHRRDELQRLFVAIELRALGDVDRHRLAELLDDDGLLDAAIDQLEVDALLSWHHGAAATATARAPGQGPVERPAPGGTSVAPSAIRWPLVLASLAAVLLVALGTFHFWPVERGHFNSPGPRSVVELDASWQVQPTGDAEFSVLDPRRIHLARGELLVRSVHAPAGTLAVTTPYGDAQATGTTFYIGTHHGSADRPPIQRIEKSKNMNPRMTRVLVLAGSVTLSNALGAATAQTNELVVAPQGDPPTRVVAASSGEFGFDLYRSLAASHPGENLFFSPYSIATALTMTAEGARGQTADEMGKVLRWPAGARRVGTDAQKIPFELARIHGGHAAINRLFNAGDTPAQRKLRGRTAELIAEMGKVQQRMNAARASRDRGAISQARRDMRVLGDEYDARIGDLKSYRLSIANALWGETTYPFAKDFLATIEASYDTGAFFPVDFRGDPAGAIARINAWVEQRTEGRIKELAQEPVINRNTRLALVNAIYFKAQWLTPFDKERTESGDFTMVGGAKVKAAMMRHLGLDQCRYGAFDADGAVFPTPELIDVGQREGLYPGAGGCQVLELPYQGRDLSMVLMLPTDADGLGTLEAGLTAAKLDTWLGGLATHKTRVRMPRFTAETAFRVDDALRNLGMVRAFKPPTGPGGADFTGMTTTTAQNEQLFIQAVLHKAFVAVDEVGTEAAAASLVAMGRTGSSPRRRPFVPYFNAERPFVYLIRDLRSGAILFLGRVTKP